MTAEGATPSRDVRQPPRWLVAIVVLLTAAGTAWAMSATELGAPLLAWNELEQGVDQIWADAPQPAPGQGQPVAGLAGIRTIIAGSPAPHPPQGVCTRCHVVVSSTLAGLAVIRTTAVRPHPERGVCENCHLVTDAVPGLLPPNPAAAAGLAPPPYSAGAASTGASPVAAPQYGYPAAGTPYGTPCPGAAPLPYATGAAGPYPAAPLAAGQGAQSSGAGGPCVAYPAAGAVAGTAPAPAPTPGPAAPPPQPTEAEWQGLEVGPKPNGVVVAGVEGLAARAGVLAGDAVSSVNGMRVAQMTDFVSATNNGRLALGTLIVRRGGQRLAFELGTAPPSGLTSPTANPPPIGAPVLPPAPPPASYPTLGPYPQAPSPNGPSPGPEQRF